MRRACVFALLLTLIAPAAAAAAGPEQTRTEWNSTRVIPASPETCPFPIQVHSEGLIHDFLYEDGTVKRLLQQNFHVEWTNLENGKVVTSPLAGPGIFYPDGTIVINGNDGRFIAHAEGPVFSNVGRTITTLEGVIFSAGQHSDSIFPNVCQALA
jgi:hypothetical protein